MEMKIPSGAGTTQGQNIDVSDQAVFILIDIGLHGEEVNKINASKPLTIIQR